MRSLLFIVLSGALCTGGDISTLTKPFQHHWALHDIKCVYYQPLDKPRWFISTAPHTCVCVCASVCVWMFSFQIVIWMLPNNKLNINYFNNFLEEAFKVTFSFKLFPKFPFSLVQCRRKTMTTIKIKFNLDTKPNFFPFRGMDLLLIHYNKLWRMNLLRVALSEQRKKKVNHHMLTANQIPEAWRLSPMPFWKTTRGPKIKVPLQLNHSGCLSQTLIITFLPSFFLPCVKHHIAFDWAV